MGFLREKVLGQATPSTTATSIYSPDSGNVGIIKTIVVCNTTAGALTFRIFLDDNGTTYSTATALFYDVSIAANTSLIYNVYIPMNDSNGNLAVRSSATGVAFTVSGAEILP